MSDGQGKLAFASAPWIDAAREILEDLVATHGEPGRAFSCCECFSDAPADVAPAGIAAWHFRIDGRSVEVGAGEIADADMNVRAGYAATLPVARLVYTPEFLAQRAADRAAGKAPPANPAMSRAPRYLVELHNRLAALTA
jgi:hypothetical protein